MTTNQFIYVNSANRVIFADLLTWQSKIQDYLNEYYGGNPENAMRTKFGDCMGKSRGLLEAAYDNPTMFRGVTNNNNML